MGKIKHTPGPWSIETQVTDFCSTDICTIYCVPSQPTEDGRGQQWVYIQGKFFDGSPSDRAENQLANAHLIAAAPEMLETLEMIYSVIRYASMDDGNEGLNGDMYGDCTVYESQIEQVRKMIAKAKGGDDAG